MLVQYYNALTSIFLLGTLFGFVLSVLLFLLYWNFKGKKNGGKYHDKIFSHHSMNLEDIQMGRMDTPPKIDPKRSWQDLNPHNYSGRMNTPPAMSTVAISRLFCPYCGKQFTLNMNQIWQNYHKVFCEFCGDLIV